MNASASNKALIGVTEDGLMMIELPAAIAGPNLWATKFKGSLKGVIATINPIGNRW